MKHTKRMFKEEFSRAIRSRGMFLALVIGCAISMINVIQYQIPTYQNNLAIDFEKFPIIYPFSVSDTWLAGNTANLESFVYFLILPILAVLPFGTSYFEDKQSGYLKGIYVRTNRKKYLSAKYTATFLTGGCAVVIPLILNLLCCIVLIPNLIAASALPHNGIHAANVFYELYFSYPMLYILIFLFIDFILGGIFACAALACSFLSDYKVIVAICPFFIQLVIHVICTMLGTIDYSSVYFAQSGYGLKHLWVLGIYFVVGICATMVIFMHKGEREDVF